MLCPICNEELEIISGGEKNIIPLYNSGDNFPIQIIVTIEINYRCNICNLTLTIPETKNYIEES